MVPLSRATRVLDSMVAMPSRHAPIRHVIVDGSNLATEGRSMPSLAQLDQAVREFIAENPKDSVTVVVDASFGHRIDPSELPTFEEAEAAGEVVSPPAGAIGRGDAFLLRIAEKTGATVLSNDSFQEFHIEHPWLFEKGRLIGGKPVPGVGWIFMERSPVRGPKSREMQKEAKRRKRADDTVVPPAADAAPKPKNRPKSVDRAIARETEEVVQPSGQKARRRRGGTPPAEPVNEPLAFITFIAAHPLGNEVPGTVVEYSSHGAFIEADGARCYMPLSAMGSPPPRRAREVVQKGDQRTFVVQAFDPQRRGIELAMPGFANVAGGPTAETVEAEIGSEALPRRSGASRRRSKAKRTEPRTEEAGPPEVGVSQAAAVPEVEPPAPLAEIPVLATAAGGSRRKRAAVTPTTEGGSAEDGAAPLKKAVRARKAPATEQVSPAGKGTAAAEGISPARKAAPAAEKLPSVKKAAGKAARSQQAAGVEKVATAEKAVAASKATTAKRVAATKAGQAKKGARGIKAAPVTKEAAGATKAVAPVKGAVKKEAAAAATAGAAVKAARPAKRPAPAAKTPAPPAKMPALKRAVPSAKAATPTKARKTPAGPRKSAAAPDKTPASSPTKKASGPRRQATAAAPSSTDAAGTASRTRKAAAKKSPG
jgi:Zc3h12a-like Ribonuclease NYN domain/S1 RNA binding domain